ncbi:hypothetical protein RUND412_010912, partial [Rhizina undulata]
MLKKKIAAPVVPEIEEMEEDGMDGMDGMEELENDEAGEVSDLEEPEPEEGDGGNEGREPLWDDSTHASGTSSDEEEVTLDVPPHISAKEVQKSSIPYFMKTPIKMKLPLRNGDTTALGFLRYEPM